MFIIMVLNHFHHISFVESNGIRIAILCALQRVNADVENPFEFSKEEEDEREQ